MFSTFPLPLMMLNAVGHIVALNPAAEEWLGVSEKRAVGQALPFSEMLAPLIARTHAMQQLVTHYECDLGPLGRVNLHVYPLPHRGRVGEGASTKEDVAHAPLLTSPLQGEVQLLVTPCPPPQHEESTAAAETAGLMAAMLAHEVKNPLTGIRGAAQLLLAEASSSQKPMLELICREVDRIGGVLARVEPFSRGVPLSLVAVNLHAALRHARAAAEAGFAQALAWHEHYDPSLPEALAAHDALVQVLVNLMKNAAEAGARALTLRTCYRSPHVCIQVEDNGPGIPDALHANVFEPFATTHGPGRGLGLAIAAKLMRDMNGELELVETGPGRTVFRLVLRRVG